MKSAKQPGYCIHCLRPSECLELDHVFPKSWYPDSTPPTIQRWTAPSCPDCNRSLGQLEIDLLVRLIGCIDPKSEAVSGLHKKALRSLGVDADELGEEEKVRRAKLRARLRSELVPPVEGVRPQGSIPGLGPPADEPTGGALPIPLAGLSMMAEKIARGCEYKYKNRRRLVTAPYGVRTLISESAFIPEPFASATRLLDFGPGCRVRRVFFTEDPNTVWYFISIWNTLNFHVRIEREAELQKVAATFRRSVGIVPTEGMRIDPYLRDFNRQPPG